jgi:hypothetical protein
MDEGERQRFANSSGKAVSGLALSIGALLATRPCGQSQFETGKSQFEIDQRFANSRWEIRGVQGVAGVQGVRAGPVERAFPRPPIGVNIRRARNPRRGGRASPRAAKGSRSHRCIFVFVDQGMPWASGTTDREDAIPPKAWSGSRQHLPDGADLS